MSVRSFRGDLVTKTFGRKRMLSGITPPARLRRRRVFAPERAAWKKGFCLVAGVDEAGRGPLAGPVTAAAVLVRDFDFSAKIDDSKRLTPGQRERAFREIRERALVGVGIVDEKLIDRINILAATARAMEQAIAGLVSRLPAAGTGGRKICFLVDGRMKLDVPYAYRTIVAGDRLSFSIACASIVAKVTRDRIMTRFDRRFPEYGFARHKGYGTSDHLERIRRFGPSPIHRFSFQPVKDLVEKESGAVL